MVVLQPAKLKPPAAEPASFSCLTDTYEEVFPAMRLFAADAVSLAPPITSTSIIHDNGCGPGIVTAEILSRHHHDQQTRPYGGFRGRGSISRRRTSQPLKPDPPPHIEATDISPAMTSAAARRGPSVRASVADSRDLHRFDDSVFTHSFSTFVILGMSTADAARVVAETHRTLRPGGVAVLTAWADLEHVALFESVARQLRPGAAVDTRGAVISERKLRHVLELGGFAASGLYGDDGVLVELRSVAREFPWTLWTHEAYGAIRRRMCEGYTAGTGAWSREDTARLDAALADRVERLAAQGRMYRMTAWVAVLRK